MKAYAEVCYVFGCERTERTLMTFPGLKLPVTPAWTPIDKVFPVREHQFSETLGSHRELWPFFKRAQELGMPLIMHNVQHGHRISNMMIFQRDGLDTLCPAEGQMSLASLCTSGLFDDFPDLKMVFTEAGSAFIKPLLDKLDAAFVKPPLNYEDEDATARFHRRVMPVSERLSAGKRLTTLAEYEVKNKQPVSHYFKKNLKSFATKVRPRCCRPSFNPFT